MSLEPRSRSRATGDGMGSLCPETKPGLCSGTHTPLPSTVSSDLQGARMIQIKVRMLYLAYFSNESRTPNFYSQIICPRHIKTAKKIRTGREKNNFLSVPNQPDGSENRGCLEEINLALSHQQSRNQIFQKFIYLFIYIYLAELGLSCGMWDLVS